MRFYGHISILPSNRLANKILVYKSKLKNIQWIEEVNNDLERAGISRSETLDRNIFRRMIEQWKDQPEREIKKNVGTKWTEERKRAHGEKMKIFCQHKKSQNRR